MNSPETARSQQAHRTTENRLNVNSANGGLAHSRCNAGLPTDALERLCRWCFNLQRNADPEAQIILCQYTYALGGRPQIQSLNLGRSPSQWNFAKTLLYLSDIIRPCSIPISLPPSYILGLRISRSGRFYTSSEKITPVRINATSLHQRYDRRLQWAQRGLGVLWVT